MDNLAGGGAHLQQGRAADKSKSIFSAGLLIYQIISLSVPTLVLIACTIYHSDFSISVRGGENAKSAQSAISAIFLPRSSYLMISHAKDVRPVSLALSGSEGT